MKIWIIFCGLLLLVTASHSSIASSEALIDDEISRGLYRAGKIEEAIAKNEQIYLDDQLTQYLKGIMDKLYPDYKNISRMHILISTESNAFVLANGSVYVNLGLLAIAENEAQVASVLAHEGAHYTLSHQLLSQQHLKDVASSVDFYGMDRSLADLSDYSVDLETEADNVGFRRLLNAGYDPKEAVNMYKSIEAELRRQNLKEQRMYPTHPKIRDRVAHFKQLSEGHSGFVGRESYLKEMSALRIKYYQLNLSKYLYKNVLASLVHKNRIADAPPEAWLYLGEAYRQRSEKDDEAKAENAYLHAIEAVPEFAPPYAALGILYMKHNDTQKALKQFDNYFALSPDTQNTAYIRQYYSEIKDNEMKDSEISTNEIKKSENKNKVVP